MKKLIKDKNREVIVNLQQLLFCYIKVIDLKQKIQYNKKYRKIYVREVQQLDLLCIMLQKIAPVNFRL